MLFFAWFGSGQEDAGTTPRHHSFTMRTPGPGPKSLPAGGIFRASKANEKNFEILPVLKLYFVIRTSSPLMPLQASQKPCLWWMDDWVNDHLQSRSRIRIDRRRIIAFRKLLYHILGFKNRHSICEYAYPAGDVGICEISGRA